MPERTAVGSPEPEDGRTPEEKYADHLTELNRDRAVETRIGQEFVAAANNDDPQVIIDWMYRQTDEQERGDG